MKAGNLHLENKSQSKTHIKPTPCGESSIGVLTQLLFGFGGFQKQREGGITI
jgi:hypothetical protein